uniref:Putative cytochrome p450 cyp11/cyp12/cyp24/cyp27 subfamily n=1 Tax=Panstrongylus lignarius TaxID=156445 RepID=A0A224XQA4_9HEMI
MKLMPERKGLPLIGTSLTILANGSAPKLHLHIEKGHKILGPIFRENMGTTSAVFISDPILMRQVFEMEGKYPKHFLPQPWTIFNEIHNCKRGLFFMDGEEWLQHRRLMNKHFLGKDVTSDLKFVHQEIVKYLIIRWKNYDGKEIIDLEHEFYRHSISFLIGSLMGSSYISSINCYEMDVEKLASIFYSIFATTAHLNGKPIKLMAKLSAPGWIKFETAVHSSLEACYEVVDKMMKNRSEDGLLDKLLNENLPINTVVAIVVDLILAAGDTTAVTSQWSLYLLSGHKEVQNALINGEINVKNVVKEALRMYPPAIFISRMMPEDTNLSGYILSQGEMVLLSLYSAGRNNDIYPSANSFKPERWIRTDGKGYEGVVDRRAYLPFAMGARACIGKYLALTQLHYTLSEVVSEFDLELQEEVDMILRLVPVPSKPIRIKIRSKK